jgi:hypothetical protein
MTSSVGYGTVREQPSNKTERATRGRLVFLVCASFAQLIEYTTARCVLHIGMVGIRRVGLFSTKMPVLYDLRSLASNPRISRRGAWC